MNRSSKSREIHLQIEILDITTKICHFACQDPHSWNYKVYAILPDSLLISHCFSNDPVKEHFERIGELALSKR